ncbi:hypothetical protein N9M66_01175 [Litoreibacter sp.]|nr:hypothetical protein [Litoreibacter sp.]
MSVILVLGSGPNVVEAQAWDRALFDHILAINNAHAVRSDWDSLIHPEDFAPDHRPTTHRDEQTIVTATDYVPAQNAFGGFVYAGGTMAFTAGYWALFHHKPSVIAFIGCDMTYSAKGSTHFYGTGAADPLRNDVTLQSLEAKSARFEIIAARQNCAAINLSTAPSRLTYPRGTPTALQNLTPRYFEAKQTDAAILMEHQLGYYVPSGRYWEVEDQFDAAKLRELDAVWLAAALAPAQPSRDT